MDRKDAIEGKKLEIGDRLDDAVRYLQECKEKGQNVYVLFSGYTLYSCDVTMDSAYMQVIGLTKVEHDTMHAELDGAITEDEEDLIIEKWEKVEEGHREEKKKIAKEVTLDEFWGDLDETVRYLQECNKRGENKYVEFKGNILYSCDVTIDSAYMQVIGLTKAESDAMEEEMNQAITRDEEDVIIEKWEKIKERHREAKDKSITKTILDSAIEATEESTRAGVIKRQAQTIISENKGRDNNIEMEIVE